LIGHHLVQTAPTWAAGSEVIGLTRALLDLEDPAAVAQMFDRQRPGLIIHCAALSRSPACQEDPALARRLNIDVTRHLAEVAAGIPLIFFSSDLVLDGREGNYTESAVPNPLSVYGETKAAAEKIVLANPRHTVVRISLNGGASPTGDRGFNEEMCAAWRAGKTLKLFTDEFRCPLPAAVTARAIWELARLNAPGLFHLGGSERLSRFQIGELVAARWPELGPSIARSSIRDYQGAPRPADTSLNCAKIQRLLSFRIPGLGEWLAANPREPF